MTIETTCPIPDSDCDEMAVLLRLSNGIQTALTVTRNVLESAEAFTAEIAQRVGLDPREAQAAWHAYYRTPSTASDKRTSAGKMFFRPARLR